MPLVCTIELSKTAGATITVENADDGITQTIVMNGTSIVTTVKGEEETSVITQIQDQIKVVVKDFIIEAETITCTSTGITSHTSEDELKLTSTKDMTFTSSANYTNEVTDDVTINSGGKTDITATGDLTGKGANATIQASTDATLKGGGNATVQATSAATLKGSTADVKADIGATVKGATVTLDGSMDTIKGSLIKLG